MRTSDLDGFNYSDMKACLIDMQYGACLIATFRIFLPPNSNDERIYEECERIPVDFMFRYLVAIHHHLTVTNVDARVIMASDDDDDIQNFALFVTCRGFYCNAYMQSLVERNRLFAQTSDESNIIHSSTVIETIPVFQNKEADITINGIFHVSTIGYREVPPPLNASRLRPYGLEINIRCINSEAMKTDGLPPYNIRNHNALYSIINDSIKEFSSILYTWMIYETTAGFKSLDQMMSHTSFHFVAGADDQESDNQLTIHIVIVPDGLFGLKFAYMGFSEMACVPIDVAEKKMIQFHDLNWGMPYRTIDPVLRRMESIHSYMMSQPNYTVVSECTGVTRKAIDDAMYFVFHFIPAIIPWGTGINDGSPMDFAVSSDVFGNTMCDYLIARTFHAVDIAFPVNGMNPRRGVLFYVRYHQSIQNTNVLGHMLPLTSRVPIYCRTIAVNDGYVVLEYIADDSYDLETIDMGGDVDKYFPSDWFPMVNYDPGSRGSLSDWINLPPTLKENTVEFFFCVIRMMFGMQINENVIMNVLNVSSHLEVLYGWMNTVGLPAPWREICVSAMVALKFSSQDAVNHFAESRNYKAKKPPKGIMGRLFGRFG